MADGALRSRTLFLKQRFAAASMRVCNPDRFGGVWARHEFWRCTPSDSHAINAIAFYVWKNPVLGRCCNVLGM